MNIFDKVLFVGPDINGKGGIASVLQAYKLNIKSFQYAPTNSHKGSIVGYFVLFFLLLKLPFIRLFTHTKIVHIHAAMGKSFVRKSIIIFISHLLGFKIVFHSHGGSAKEYYARRGIRNIKNTLDKCDAIIVLSDYWKKYYETTFGYKNVVVINNIVSHGNPHNELTGIINLLFLGVINEAKGIFDLVNTIGNHKDFLSGKIHLTICGDGENNKIIERIRYHKIDDIVQFYGWVSGHEKDRMIENCNIVILPSYIEGVPITLLEAMAYGKPVISTTVGGIPSIIHNGVNGFITEPGNKEAIFNAIKHYINNPDDLITHGNNGLEIVKDYYPETVTTQLEILYKTII